MIPETSFYVFTSWTRRDQEQGCCGFCAADVLQVLMNHPTSNILGILNHCKILEEKVTWSHLLFAVIFVSCGLQRPCGCVTTDPLWCIFLAELWHHSRSTKEAHCNGRWRKVEEIKEMKTTKIGTIFFFFFFFFTLITRNVPPAGRPLKQNFD